MENDEYFIHCKTLIFNVTQIIKDLIIIHNYFNTNISTHICGKDYTVVCRQPLQNIRYRQNNKLFCTERIRKYFAYNNMIFFLLSSTKYMFLIYLSYIFTLLFVCY